MKTWMVRAGRGGKFFEQFRSRNEVAIGWNRIGDISSAASRDIVAKRVQEAFPLYRPQQALMAASQLFRFAKIFKIGDRVVTYDSGSRRYLCGIITGEYVHNPNATDEEFLNTRTVDWKHEKPRDELSSTAQNSLGAISTIFEISEFTSAELWSENTQNHTKIQNGHSQETDENASISDAGFDEIATLASEKIKDWVSNLDWEQMQELVAGLLRALGYKTVVSPSGPDRGKDIVASPDGFGFQEPRIVVEVKHRPNQRMGAQEIRSFLGGRHSRDRGLYVSTGGFSKDAYYEADRASIPLTLMDFEMLAEAVVMNYENMDIETKQLVPLKPIYWVFDR